MRAGFLGLGVCMTAICLSACMSASTQTAAPESAVATDQEKTAAMNTYIACVHNAAHKIDDGRSDAASVALAIEPLCAGEFQRSVEASEQGMSPYARRMFEEGVQPVQLQLGTTAVLDERRARAAN